jgi:hypothetical protein
LGTPSPNGPGQPGAPATTCQQFPTASEPAGFQTGATSGKGFTLAGNQYAGSPANPTASPTTNANTSKAIAQYDIACFQTTTH